MRDLATDLSVFGRFGFQHAPVGVKLLFEKPEGLERLQISRGHDR